MARLSREGLSPYRSRSSTSQQHILEGEIGVVSASLLQQSSRILTGRTLSKLLQRRVLQNQGMGTEEDRTIAGVIEDEMIGNVRGHGADLPPVPDRGAGVRLTDEGGSLGRRRSRRSAVPDRAKKIDRNPDRGRGSLRYHLRLRVAQVPAAAENARRIGQNPQLVQNLQLVLLLARSPLQRVVPRHQLL